MEIRNLLRSQANEIFHVIKTAGFEPSDFEWQDADNLYSGQVVSRLVHKPSGYSFSFANSDEFHSDWSPADQTKWDAGNDFSWTSQLDWFVHWLTYLRRETESPDLWGAISSGAQVLESAASADTSNAPFTAEEKEYIVQGINEIKEYLLTAHKLGPGIRRIASEISSRVIRASRKERLD
jgi:hypothetical protein